MPWFRVATQGATTDGREISREWIEQMAGNYDPKTYGARVWMEHMRGLFHDGPFAALGDVTRVKAEEVEDGKLALFAEIDPTERLKEINQQRQKVYTSIEVNPSFADTGEAYLEGLAVTDSPASLGTEMLKFSRQAGKDSPLAAKKQHPDNVFSEAVEIELDFTEDPPEQKGPKLTERVKAMFSRHDAKTAKGFEAFRAELEETLELFVQRHQAMSEDLEQRPSAEAFSELKEAHDETKRRLDELYTQLDNTPDTPPRGTATGGGDAVLTDC
ncbi:MULTISPECIES: GPO family capsid scaffolding protein [Halomonas]|uniref:GPO family capsid scaffolding protein n=1 Tax=Halomonas TaxID=2745 RepID=UPI001C977589|nr:MULTISPECIES: GPO family capsid scaffolding protein [Halomonas]MBY6206876.1 GPO family capsid scaffolding protein [Halomonas sp. DP3Y7-2]MBY6230350.1 GPO family capsid scaffolding protein [Halomonas sp. DP3Y7-1]MCA0918511.1 GPO family capsid scaffolding protein [Halomonas denitrificans]